MAGEEIKIGADDRELKTADEGVEELRAKLAEEKERRLAAEARETKLKGDLHVTKGEVAQTNLEIVESAIDKLNTDRDMAKQHYRSAREAGDIDAEIEANDRLADIAAKVNQLVLGRDAMKANPNPQRGAQVATGDPVEDLARGMERDGHAASAAWVRKHPEYARDNDMYREMIAAHNIATGKRFKLAPNTDEYFRKVEEVLGINPATRHEEHRDDAPGKGEASLSGASAAVGDRTGEKPPAAAPPSRGGQRNAVRLSVEQKEAAKISGISEEEYAQNLSRANGKAN